MKIELPRNNHKQHSKSLNLQLQPLASPVEPHVSGPPLQPTTLKTTHQLRLLLHQDTKAQLMYHVMQRQTFPRRLPTG
ncbi:hypothetical protein CDV31_007384 [Fusarium ambrosium]|uniref:Uncharacterized protein n=1 Tax=Fusarium ambrosium TaxID=131363 RepID=A0A428U6X1_9HYPO|nr:hypothetical protein CDV31_007384 [Fusarium ambrosium]